MPRSKPTRSLRAPVAPKRAAPTPQPIPEIAPVDFDRDPDDRLCTPHDICRWLGVSIWTVRHLQEKPPPKGLPPSMKIGAHRRWRLGSLRKWIIDREAATNGGRNAR